MLIRCLLLWLSIASVRSSELKCPDISTMFVEADCEANHFCEMPKVSTDGSFSCSADTTFEGRETMQSPWEPLKGVKCAANFIVATKTKGGSVSTFDDFTQFRCTAPVCTVDVTAAFKPSFCVAGETCDKATNSKSKLTCPANFAVELKKADGRRIDITSNRCVGAKLTTDGYDGPMEEFGCRTMRGCTDMDRYFDDSCGLKEKCTVPSDLDSPCHFSDLKVSYTEKIAWENSADLTCVNNQLFVDGVKDFPIALQCLKPAVCDLDDMVSYYDRGDCDANDCASPGAERGKTMVVCHSTKYLMEFHKDTSDPWKLAGDIGCYNKYLVDNASNQKVEGKLRCRKRRGNDMSKYFIGADCDQRKKCSLPDKTSGGKYACNEEGNGLTLDLQGKLTKTGNWIDIEWAEFRDPVFVMKEKQGAETPYIPIQFRCIRDATCEVKFNIKPKFDSTKCPTQDQCETPVYNTPAEKKIICKTAEMAIEYQSTDDQAWQELTEIGCYNDIIEPKSGAVSISAADVNMLRCRKLRKCELGKYYNGEIDDCKTRSLCAEPEKDASITTSVVYKCAVQDYEMQYQALGYGSNEKWTNIDQFKCESDRFVLVEKQSDGQMKDLPDIPVALRCALNKKCDLKHFKDDSCNADTEICEEAIPGTTAPYDLTCSDPIMALRVKDKPDSQWEVVQKITCDGEGFSVIREHGQKYDKFPLRIQCVKLKTTTCLDPCAGHQPDCGHAKFVAPTKWNEPAKHGCGPNKILVLGHYDEGKVYKNDLTCAGKKNDKGDDLWLKNEEDKDGSDKCLDAKCLKASSMSCIDRISCIAHSPIKTHCDSNTTDCAMTPIRDYRPITCTEGQLTVIIGRTKDSIIADNVTCDPVSGLWEVMAGGNLQKLEKDDYPNVVCKYGPCAANWMDDLFPLQDQDDCTFFAEFCARPRMMEGSTRIIECPSNSKPWFWDAAWNDWYQMPGSSGKFMCCNSEVVQLTDVDGVEEKDYQCHSMVEKLQQDNPKVKCMRKADCTEYAPLKSDCGGRSSPACNTRKFDDNWAEYTCDVKRGFYFMINGVIVDPEMNEIYCRGESEWQTNTGSVALQKGDNVVCVKGAFSGSTLSLIVLLSFLVIASR